MTSLHSTTNVFCVSNALILSLTLFPSFSTKENLPLSVSEKHLCNTKINHTCFDGTVKYHQPPHKKHHFCSFFLKLVISSFPRSLADFSFFSLQKKLLRAERIEREIHLTTDTNAMHLPSTYLTQPHDILGAPTTNILTLFPRWLPLVVIFVVSRETLFGMNLSIISALSGIVDSCALLENDDSAQMQRCSGDHRMAKYDLPCLQSTSNASFPPNDEILFKCRLSSSSSFSNF